MGEPTVDTAEATLGQLWSDLQGPRTALDAVTIAGPAAVLPSVFDVTGFASATVAMAALAVAELAATRSGAALPAVTVDRLQASASFKLEALLRPRGWELPPIWDAVAGDYVTADGWIKLHTNYRAHLDAALTVLGVPADREQVAASVVRWGGDELEAAVVAAGGCAAVLRTEQEWSSGAAGLATADERPVSTTDVGVGSSPPPVALLEPSGDRPLAGVRVLDLTRVIAGPVATRYLAAYGADVLRIDPPGFEEVGALLPETTAGKRCAALDLHQSSGRERFLELVAEAHVLVGGLRPDALAALGLDAATLRSVNPTLVDVRLDAYGWSGPWQGRRGFDSLVQMSTGIAAAGAARAGTDRPTPLPAQALDHGLGHLVAAACCRALARLVTDGVTADVRASLVGASNVLRALPAPDAWSPAAAVADAHTIAATTHWGPVERVPLAGQIDGIVPAWTVDAGPIGRHEAAFG